MEGKCKGMFVNPNESEDRIGDIVKDSYVQNEIGDNKDQLKKSYYEFTNSSFCLYFTSLHPSLYHDKRSCLNQEKHDYCAG